MVKKRSSRNYNNNDGLDGYIDLDVDLDSTSGRKELNDGFLGNEGPKKVNVAEEKSDSPTTTGDTGNKKQLYKDLSVPNPLFEYASYNVLFTLSALSQGELEDTRRLLASPPHDIIARSSGIGPDANTVTSNLNDEVASPPKTNLHRFTGICVQLVAPRVMV